MIAEPDDRKILCLIREFEAAKVARRKAQHHAELLGAYARRLRRQLTTATASLA